MKVLKNIKKISVINANVMGKGRKIPVTSKKKKGNIFLWGGGLVLSALLVSWGYNAGTDFYDAKVKPWFVSSIGGDVSPENVQEALLETQSTAISKGVNPNLIGEESELTFNVYDREADNPNTLVSAVPLHVTLDPNGVVVKDQGNYLSSTTITTLAVGNQIDIAGGNYSGYQYYVEGSDDVIIAGKRVATEIDAHAIQTLTNMAVYGYDNTGSAALTAAGGAAGSAEVDYNITLGASQQKVIYLKLANEAANKMSKMGAVCTGTVGDIKILEPVGSMWKKVLVPTEVADADVGVYDGAAATNGTWEGCWRYQADSADAQMDLSEWEDTGIIKFEIEAKSTDPAGDHKDFAYAVFLDSWYGLGSDGKLTVDFYRHDTNEKASEIGLDELADLRNPYGLDVGVVIEGL